MDTRIINTIIQILFIVCAILQIYITMQMYKLKETIMKELRVEYNDVIRQREFDELKREVLYLRDKILNK